MMDDLIYRQDAINAIITEGRTVDSRYLESERILHESDAVEAISMLPSAEKWIPMSEKPPEKTGRYLVTNCEFEVDWNIWVNGEWLYQNDAPIAWMNMPEPFEGGDDE